MSNNLLKTPIRSLNKVGPKFEKLLEKLEIATIGDLLYHIPFRYEDYSKKVAIVDAQIGDAVSITGLLGKVINIASRFGKRLTISKLADTTGSISLIWFNQHYLKTTLRENNTYTVSGKVALYKNKKCMFSPEFEEGDGGVNTARLVSVYRETAGISSKWLRARNNDVIDSFDQNLIDEFLPWDLIKRKKFPEIQSAFRNVHFPQSLNDAGMARNRFEFEEMFLELLKVEKRKIEWQEERNGCQIARIPSHKEINRLIAGLPFKLTSTQNSALEDIFTDLECPTPMNRLLEGDVGSGKTIVSLIAAYATHLGGFKTVLMAPTEILAQQHYKTFNKILGNVDQSLKVVLKTSTTHSKISEDFDIAIGTHALLYFQETVNKIGLVIIDEQHRFGVEQRTMLLNIAEGGKVPNMLSMTATPIPRTLSLTLYGDLDISLLQPHTKEGRKITTKVASEKSRGKLYTWIKQKNQQTFIVCPFIDQSENVEFENVKAAEKEFKELQKILPIGEMRLIHGRMKAKDKQMAVEEFKSGKIKYLVSTPVIEVGIDVPEASIIVIESAERYGLASLHQLRGRVGRTGQEGYCFLVNTGSSSRSRERLTHMENCDDGMALAELDLKMRGQGDIFGTMQSGVKRFKIADAYNVAMLEDAKKEAQRYVSTLDRYPLLKERLEETGKFVGQN